MKERGILFSAPMVHALLAGTKTQTRQTLRVQPPAGTFQVISWHHPDPRPHFFAWGGDPAAIADGWCCSCPYGQPGDRLWVREAWARTGITQAFGAEMVVYREGNRHTDYGGPWKPSIHMFRRDSRITPDITEVRVEQLQDISEADAKAEGTRPADRCDHNRRSCAEIGCSGPSDYRGGYRKLWVEINGPGSWQANPWVWVVSFHRVAS